MGQNIEKGDTLYTTKKEVKTFGIDFSAEGAVQDGGVLSDPVVTIVKHSSTEGSPTVPTHGLPQVVPAGVVFSDSDNRKIRAGKGVRVQVDSTGATLGMYALSCVVTVTPVDGDPDTLEGGGVLVVE